LALGRKKYIILPPTSEKNCTRQVPKVFSLTRHWIGNVTEWRWLKWSKTELWKDYLIEARAHTVLYTVNDVFKDISSKR
jgi:hypothetical protein